MTEDYKGQCGWRTKSTASTFSLTGHRTVAGKVSAPSLRGMPLGTLARHSTARTQKQKHSIDARNQPLRATAIVFIICSKSQAERGLFNMNAIQHRQRRGNEDSGKTGPCACVNGKS